MNEINSGWESHEMDVIDEMGEIESTTLEDVYDDIQLTFDFMED